MLKVFCKKNEKIKEERITYYIILKKIKINIFYKIYASMQANIYFFAACSNTNCMLKKYNWSQHVVQFYSLFDE